jgi:ABC-type polysaccharide/polyol phosphate export permease
LLQGCGCFFQGEAYIRQFPAPMAIYPLRTVLASAFHFAIGLLLAIVLALFLGPVLGSDSDVPTTRLDQLQSLPCLLPTLVLLLFFGWSVAVLFGLLNVRFRDTHHLAEIGLQGLFYVTPIMYPATLLKVRRLGVVLQCNPLVPFLDLLREPILHGHVPSLQTYAAAGLIVLVLTTAAILALKVEERRLIFYL